MDPAPTRAADLPAWLEKCRLEREASAAAPDPGPPPQVIDVGVSNICRIRRADLPAELIEEMRRALTFPNPLYARTQASRRQDTRITKYLTCWWHEGEDLCFTRGFAGRAMRMLQAERLKGRFNDTTDPPSRMDIGFHLELTRAQVKAANDVESSRFFTISGPMGTGKKILSMFLAHRRQAGMVVVVHDLSRLYLWRAAARRALADPDRVVGLVGDGHKEFGRPVTIGTYQGLLPAMGRGMDTALCVLDQADSCHLNVYRKMVNRWRSPYMIGLCDREERRDGLDGWMAAYLGPRAATIEAPAFSIQPRPRAKVAGTAFSYDYHNDHPAMMAAIAADTNRTALVVEHTLALAADDLARVVVVCKRMDQVRAVAAGLSHGYRHCDILDRSVTDQRCAELLDRFNRRRNQVLVLTDKSLPRIEGARVTGLVIAAPSKDPSVIAQAVSMLSQGHADGPDPVIIDFKDPVKALRPALRARLKAYRAVGAVSYR